MKVSSRKSRDDWQKRGNINHMNKFKRTIIALVAMVASLFVVQEATTLTASATATGCHVIQTFDAAGGWKGGYAYCESLTGGYWVAVKVNCGNGYIYGPARYLAYQTSSYTCPYGVFAHGLTYVTGAG